MSDEKPTNAEQKVATVQTFHDQIMDAILDHHEEIFFDRVESFFQKIAKDNYARGFEAGMKKGADHDG